MDRSQHKHRKGEPRQAWDGRLFADAELRQRDQDLRDPIEATPAIAWTTRPDGSAVFASKRWTEYTDSPAEALPGCALLAVIRRDERAFHTAKRRKFVTAGERFVDGRALAAQTPSGA